MDKEEPEDMREELFLMPIEPEEQYISDTSTYAQTLSNTVLALVQWDTMDPEAFAFCRMMIKKLVDTQVELKDLYIGEAQEPSIAGAQEAQETQE